MKRLENVFGTAIFLIRHRAAHEFRFGLCLHFKSAEGGNILFSMKKAVVIFILLCILGTAVFADDQEYITSEDYLSDVIESILQQEIIIGREDVQAPDTQSELGRPSVALVLSGGGAKGVAHIAVIEALEKYGIPIDKVFGTSMGALIGGLYAAGLSPAEMKEVVRSNDLTKLFTAFESTGYNEVLDAFDFNSNNVLSLSLGQGIGGVSGLIDDYMILNFLTSYVGNVPDGIDFDKDLVVPFECNAANLLDGNEVIFTGGNLVTAMRSSMSIPVVFEPVVIDESLVLVDGGAVCNYIAHRAMEEGYDIIIVVTLDGYRKKVTTAEDVESLSGVLGASLGLVLDNVSRGELALADYWFSPDVTAYTTFSFGDADAILEAGEKMAEEEADRFKSIASLFTEEQKVYKDPNRVGDYYLRYQVKTKEEHLASKDTRHEDLLGRTRLSLGVYGGGGYGFFFREDAKEETWRAFYPTLSLRSFVKDVGGSAVSLDIRLKSTMNWSTDLSIMGLLRLTPDRNTRIFGMARIRGSVGSLTYWTDTSSIIRFNILEGLVAADAGLMITNEHNYNFLFYASADNMWSLMNESEGERMYGFIPSATLEAVYYPDYTNGFFSVDGGRYDFVASGGYYTSTSKWFYKLAFAAENTFEINQKLSLWYDLTAYSNHGNSLLRSSFEEYGGWDGMPGYAMGTLYGEFMTLGFGAQYQLSKSFTTTYIAAVIRGGVRADVKYDSSWAETHEFTSYVPFKDCFESGLWDLGISVGYGIGTPVGDIILGVGFNKNLQLALFVQLT